MWTWYAPFSTAKNPVHITAGTIAAVATRRIRDDSVCDHAAEQSGNDEQDLIEAFEAGHGERHGSEEDRERPEGR